MSMFGVHVVMVLFELFMNNFGNNCIIDGNARIYSLHMENPDRVSDKVVIWLASLADCIVGYDLSSMQHAVAVTAAAL